MTEIEITKNQNLFATKFNYQSPMTFNYASGLGTSLPPDGKNNLKLCEIGVRAIILIKLRLTTIAENMLINTPIARVTANPCTIVAPSWSENQ